MLCRFNGLDEGHLGRYLPHGADYLGVAGMAYQQQMIALPMAMARLHVHFRHQWAGRINVIQILGIGAIDHRLRYSVRTKHHRTRAVGLRNIIDLVDEYDAARPEIINDILVMDDLMPDIHGRAVHHKQAVDNLHGALDSGAKPMRIGNPDG